MGGFWFEGTPIDDLDKWVSRQVLCSAPLPFPLEAALSVPGMWFGNVVCALGLVPLALLSLVPVDQEVLIRRGGRIVLSIGLLWWVKVCSRSHLQGVEGKTFLKVYMVPHQFFFFLPHIMTGLSMLGNKEGQTMVALYLSSWLGAQLAVRVLKTSTLRLRPAAALQEEPGAQPRSMPEVTSLLRHPSEVRQSFPSGDVAGASACGVSLALCAVGGWQLIALAVPVLSAAGRVYFQAHYLSDVLTGGLVGGLFTCALHRAGTPSWLHVLALQILLVCTWPAAPPSKEQASPEADAAAAGGADATASDGASTGAASTEGAEGASAGAKAAKARRRTGAEAEAEEVE